MKAAAYIAVFISALFSVASWIEARRNPIRERAELPVVSDAVPTQAMPEATEPAADEPAADEPAADEPATESKSTRSPGWSITAAIIAGIIALVATIGATYWGPTGRGVDVYFASSLVGVSLLLLIATVSAGINKLLPGKELELAESVLKIGAGILGLVVAVVKLDF